jgi:hypothetical protein
MTTPSRYEVEKRDWEKKSWLQEQYWGQLKSSERVAEEVDVNPKHIRRQLAEFGIPRRYNTYRRRSPMSPFSGFYTDDENATVSGDEVNTATYDEEQQPDGELEADWNQAARVSQ